MDLGGMRGWGCGVVDVLSKRRFGGVQPAPMGSGQSDTIADNQDGYVKGAMERVGEDAAKGSGRVGLA